MVPEAYTGYHYIFEIPGQVLVDDDVVAIYLENLVAGKSYCGPAATFTASGFESWSQFNIATPVVPATRGYMYFVTYNAPSSHTTENPTGLRVEFTSPYFVPVK